MKDISSKIEYQEIIEKKDNIERIDDIQTSTSASNLNNSVDNLGAKNETPLDITEEIKAESRRKLSAPFSISQNAKLNIEKNGKGTRMAYFNKLLSKGLFC